MLNSPSKLADRPFEDVSLDLLTELIAAIHVKNALYGGLEATAPWGIDFRSTPHAKFGMVVRGSCWLTSTTEPQPLSLRGGDCFLVSEGTKFALRDAPRSRATACDDLTKSNQDGIIRIDGGGVPTTVISGWFEFDEWSGRPLVELLPPVLCLFGHESQTAALRMTLELLSLETTTPGLGAPILLSRLADMILVHAIRAYIASGVSPTSGWLIAFGNVQIRAALLSMHSDIARRWSVEDLAIRAGMSRSSFAVRFKELVGEPPLEYLTKWRMYKAGALVREGNYGLADIASRVGYESVGAFIRAFKRAFDQTPREFERTYAARN
jgi:AraC-like DNA-binding protein